MNLKIEKRQVGGVTVVSCQGRIMFGDEANALRDFLKQTLADSQAHGPEPLGRDLYR